MDVILCSTGKNTLERNIKLIKSDRRPKRQDPLTALKIK